MCSSNLKKEHLGIALGWSTIALKVHLSVPGLEVRDLTSHEEGRLGQGSNVPCCHKLTLRPTRVNIAALVQPCLNFLLFH